MLTFLRYWAALIGMGLMIGEAIRSWGAGRHWIYVADDCFIGIPMVITALLLTKNTLTRRRAFSSAWAAVAGMTYHSFFGKLLDPASTNAGNIPVDLLTWLIGSVFISALIGLALSLYVKPPAA